MLSGDSDKRAPPPLLTSARKKQKQMLEQQLVAQNQGGGRNLFSLNASDETRWLVTALPLLRLFGKEGSVRLQAYACQKGVLIPASCRGLREPA
jgi:hypothetical protein